MSGNGGTEYPTLIIRGPAGKFYAIPVEDLAEYIHDLTPEKQARLDSLVEQSLNNGRAVDAFYHDKPIADGESSALVAD